MTELVWNERLKIVTFLTNYSSLSLELSPSILKINSSKHIYFEEQLENIFGLKIPVNPSFLVHPFNLKVPFVFIIPIIADLGKCYKFN